MSESAHPVSGYEPEACPRCKVAIRRHNALVEQFEAEHDLRLRLEVKLRLANEELAKFTEPERWYCLGCANATAYHHICHGTRVGRACDCQACPSALMAQRAQREAK